MVMQTPPRRTHSAPESLCDWRKSNPETLKPNVAKVVLMQLSAFPQVFTLPFQFSPFATLHSGMLNLQRKQQTCKTFEEVVCVCF